VEDTALILNPKSIEARYRTRLLFILRARNTMSLWCRQSKHGLSHTYRNKYTPIQDPPLPRSSFCQLMLTQGQIMMIWIVYALISSSHSIRETENPADEYKWRVRGRGRQQEINKINDHKISIFLITYMFNKGLSPLVISIILHIFNYPTGSKLPLEVNSKNLFTKA
jgi:hypothetical protein